MTADVNGDNGFTLMETLVALAVFSLVAVAVVRAAPQAAGNVRRAAAAGADGAEIQAVLERALAAGPCALANLEDSSDNVRILWTPVRRLSAGQQLYRIEAWPLGNEAQPLVVTHLLSAKHCR